MSFEDDLKAEYEAERPFIDVELKLNGNIHTLRFTQMDAEKWATATDQAPPRPNVAIDKRYGYNIRAVVALVVADCGKRVEGDTLVDLTEDQWRNLLKAAAGAPVMRIGDAIFYLNEGAHDKALSELKKASGAAFGLKSA